MLNKLTEIYDGWKNLVFGDKSVECVARKRITVCVSCEKLNSRNYCKLCGCYMPAKTRNIKAKCMLSKW